MDPTEDIRFAMVVDINLPANPDPAEERARLEGTYGRVWDTEQLREDYEVTGFLAPFVVVRRKADGVVGSLTFTHHPRFYFGFVED